MLMCPVRDCGLPLTSQEEKGRRKRLVCPHGHSFDFAREGYVNLLQPQERKSKQPGDTPAAVEARRRLHDRGVTRSLLDAIHEFLAATPDEIVLDAGCGDGFYLGNLAQRAGFGAHGVDISAPAVRAAARRFPPGVSCAPGARYEWIVANADRFLPYSDESFSRVLSITARMNAPEFRRVLRPGGRLLVAVPSPLDLMELRGGEQHEEGRDRVPATVETFARAFTLIGQRRVSTTVDLDAESVRDVLFAIYRPLRARPIEAMRLTFSLDMLLFER